MIRQFKAHRFRYLGLDTRASDAVLACTLLKEAIRQNCPAIIVAHNHPSGDPTPSPEDVAVTAELVKAGGWTSASSTTSSSAGAGTSACAGAASASTAHKPQDAARLLGLTMAALDQEQLRVLLLNTNAVTCGMRQLC